MDWRPAILPALTLLYAADALPPVACWGNGYTRSGCCYAPPGHRRCFDNSGFTFEECCAPEVVVVGASAFHGHLGGDEFVKDFLAPLLAQAQRAGLAGPAAPAATVARHLYRLRAHLVGLLNSSRAANAWTPPGEQVSINSLPAVGSAYWFLLTYFVALEALWPQLRPRLRRSLLRREVTVWELITNIYRTVFGHTDFCRCMEAGEFYSHVRSSLQQAGFSRRSFVRTLFNWTSPEHHALVAQGCSTTPMEQFLPEQAMSLIFTTGCVSGDVGISLLMVENCVLEQDVERVLLLHDTMLRLGTLAADCHDAHFWGFTIRDVATELARILWEIARQPAGPTAVAGPFLRRLAWAPKRGRQNPAQAWHQQCGPHELRGPLRLVASGEAAGLRASTVGPLCTELGRFWLRYEVAADATAPQTTLVVLPVTYHWWPNPWHHLHWWIPALWMLRLSLRLATDHVELGLAFPDRQAHWGKAVATRASGERRTEPPSWSFLQTSWARTTPEALRPWGPSGLHADVLAWLSARPARPLGDLAGRSYARVLAGLPPMRFTLQAPRITCWQIAAVKHFVRATPQYAALAAQGAAGRPAGGAGDRRLLLIIQRSREEGRSIENLPEVEEVVQRHFGGKLSVRVTRGLGKGMAWTAQFKLFAEADIVMGVGGAALGWIWALPQGGAVIELRARGSPAWLPCSERWAADGREMFGGLARLAGVHHICVRPHGPQDAVAARELSDPSDMAEYRRDASVFVQPERAEALLRRALHLVASEPIPCNNFNDLRS